MESCYLAEKRMTKPGYKAWVIPLTFGRARIIYGLAEADWVEDGW